MDVAAMRRNARRFTYHSFGVVDDQVLEKSHLYQSSEGCLLVVAAGDDRTVVYWACDSGQVLRGALRDYIRAHGDAEVLVEFVPPHFIPQLESIGFVVHCEYVDFWLDQVEPLRDTARSSPIQIREATPEEHCIICSITRRCARQSRGFTVETRESLRTWLEEKDNALVVAVEHGLVVGHAMLAVYGFESPSGAVVWIRELAVEPDSQRKGIGRQLLVYGLRWGLARGAKRSFLACDAENQPAIRLYERFGYRRAAGRGQIDMAYVGSGDNPCAR